MEALKKLFGGSLRQFGMLFVLVALAIFFHLMTGGLVITPTNLMNLLNGNSHQHHQRRARQDAAAVRREPRWSGAR